MAFFVEYLHNIELFNIIDRFFGSIRKKKGIPVHELVKQILCFFIDGSSRNLSYFDKISKDEGYAGSIETDIKDMASSHQVKRFLMLSLLYGFFYSANIFRSYLYGVSLYLSHY